MTKLAPTIALNASNQWVRRVKRDCLPADVSKTMGGKANTPQPDAMPLGEGKPAERQRDDRRWGPRLFLFVGQDSSFCIALQSKVNKCAIMEIGLFNGG